jgi:O-antigen/teichoic acid export membrane protein
MGLVSSVRWVAVSQAARVLSQLVSMAVLAHLLPSSSYGLMAMAMTVTNLAFLCRDLGTSTAIIQRKELPEALLSSIYWLNMLMALVIALALLLLAWPLAQAYQAPPLAAILAALALAFPLSSLGAVQQALLEREARFRQLARIEATSAGGGLALALLLAWQGAGVWSLVLQMLFSTALATAQTLHACRWRAGPWSSLGQLRSVLGFGAHLSLFQCLIYLERNADSMIVGRVLGSAALGVYAMAYKFMLFPLQNITGVASRALLPAMSRRQGSPQELGQLYLRATGTIVLLSAPLMAGMFFLREPLVALCLGPHWSGVAELLKWLAGVGLMQSVSASTGAVFVALGRARLLFWLGLLGAVLQVGAFFIGVRWGIEGVAVSYFVANLLNVVPAFACVLSLLRIEPAEACRALGKPVLAAAFMLAVLWALDHNLAALPLAGAFWLDVGVGAAAYGFALFVLLRQDVSDVRALLRFA